MEIYANSLENSLKSITDDSLKVNPYRPSIPKWLLKGKIYQGITIRYARYLSYPNQAKHNQGTINHILDQSYAHLLNAIDPVRSVITVHDLIPILAWKGSIPGLSYPHYPLFYKLTVASLCKARTIIAVSQSTKRDLVTHCGLSDKKITVVYNGVDNRFRPMPLKEKDSVRRSFGFPDQDTLVILITGNQSYKNHSTSLKVVARLQHIIKKPIQLVWLGADNYVYDKYIREVDLHKRVICLNNLNIEQLVGLYNSVDCLLFPSWYEGFGWPPLEAMACGTPVVTSNVASLTEIVADAAPTAQPDDISGLTEAVKLLLEDEHHRNHYINMGLINASRFTWERCASQVANVYQQVLNDTI
jgi:glycosyltransferase involved in cell wall biosynthesis